MKTPQNRMQAYLRAGGGQLLVLLGLFALSGLSWAAGGSAAAQAEMHAVLDTSGMAGDPSTQWLQMVFGSWILKLAGGGGGGTTIITVVGGFSNILALTFAMIASIYVLIAGAVRTAHEGEIMGKSWSTVWLPVRSAIGLGLLMPTSIGGGFVSVTQAFIMWCALVGANAANIVWDKSVSMLAAGTPVSTVAPTNVYGYSATVFSIMTCVESLRYAGITSPLEKTVGDTTSYGDVGQCGKITLPSIPTGSAAPEDFAAQIKIQAAQSAKNAGIAQVEALQGIAADLISLVGNKAYDDAMMSRTGPQYASIQSLSARYIQAVDAFGARVNGDKNSAFNNGFNAKFEAALKKGGWSSAGLWTYNLARIQDSAAAPFQVLMGGAEAAGALEECGTTGAWDSIKEFFGANSCPAPDTILDIAMANKFTGMSARSPRDSQVSADDISLVSSLGSSGTGYWKNASSYLAKGILSVAVEGGGLLKSNGSAGSQMSGQGSVSDTLGMADPFVTSTNIGNAMRFGGQVILVSGMALEAAAVGAGENAVAKAFGGSALGRLAQRVMDLIVVTVMGLSIGGYFLAYAIPFMPTSIWIMQIVGWLLTVVEAFVAAPLAVAQMLLPEGEGIMGTRMERVLALLAAMTLRPALMLMGLFAALAVARVGFSIYNQFFWATAGSMVTLDFFALLSIMALYTTGLVVLCRFCLSIMYRLPNEVLNWFSAGSGGAFGEQDASRGVEEGVGKGGQAGGEALKGAGQRGEERKRKDREDRAEAREIEFHKERMGGRTE